MTEQATLPDTEEPIDAPTPAEELAQLRERAKLMGIPVPSKIGVDALRQKIAAKLAGEAEAGSDNADEAIPVHASRDGHHDDQAGQDNQTKRERLLTITEKVEEAARRRQQDQERARRRSWK